MSAGRKMVSTEFAMLRRAAEMDRVLTLLLYGGCGRFVFLCTDNNHTFRFCHCKKNDFTNQHRKAKQLCKINILKGLFSILKDSEVVSHCQRKRHGSDATVTTEVKIEINLNFLCSS